MSTRTIDPPVAAHASAPAAPSLTAALAAARSHRRPVELWNPWSCRAWPCTATEEAAFVAELDVIAAEQPRTARDDAGEGWDRRDVTALVTALRSGLTARELLDRARGLRGRRLLAAHATLDARRCAATEAWRSIVADPTCDGLDRWGASAATLLPVVISHLGTLARRYPGDLAAAVARADHEIGRTARSAELVEERLERCTSDERAREVGALLYDLHGDGAWALGTFLAPRVGTLVPLRVAALLGEGTPGNEGRVG